VAGELRAGRGGEVVRPRDGGLELREQPVADGGVADRLVGVAKDDEAVPHRPVVENDLLDLEVAGDCVVAALARQGGLGASELGRPGGCHRDTSVVLPRRRCTAIVATAAPPVGTRQRCRTARAPSPCCLQ